MNIIKRLKKIKSQGFALIGVILVLMVIGAILSIGARLIKPSAQKQLRVETIDTTQAAKDAVIGYAAANYQLPSDTQFPSIARNPKDPYGKDLIYLYANDLTSDICGRRTTGLTGSSVSKTGTDLAFLILSGFDDYSVDSTDTGGSITVSKSYSSADTVTIPNTDRAEWVSLKELQILAGCAESANSSRVVILNNSLPSSVGGTYNATIFADGGVPFTSGSGDYKWCWKITVAFPFVTLTCSGTLSKSNACSLATGTWQQCTSLVLSSADPKTEGTHYYTFYVKDDDDNIDQRSLTLTVVQAGEYKVYNNIGKYDFKFLETGECKRIRKWREIRGSGRLRLNYGYSLERYSTNNRSCGGAVQETFSYDDAKAADDDGDNKVWFSGRDR